MSIKKIVILFLLLGACVGLSVMLYFGNAQPKHNGAFSLQSDMKEGDLIFQTSLSSQSKAIQLATNSPYSHCGIIYRSKGKWMVYEASQKVKQTNLDEWIRRGKNQKYVTKRLKNAEQVLTQKVLAKMKKIGESFARKDYDVAFEWNDDKMYCSELVWKIYERGAGIKVGNTSKLSSFDLTNPVVRQKLVERYGNTLPLDEEVISPAAIFESPLLVTVIER